MRESEDLGTRRLRPRALTIAGALVVTAVTWTAAPATPVAAASEIGAGLTATATATWAEPARNAELSDVGCSAPTRCVAASFPGLITTDGGTTWQRPQPSTVPAPSIQAVECQPGRCIAIVEGTLRHTTDIAGTWTDATVPAGVLGAQTLTCSNAALCRSFGITASGQTVVLRSGDGGATWQSSPTTWQTAAGALACSSASLCVVPTYSQGVGVSADGGATWSTASGLPAVPYTVAECPSATTCVVGGSGGWAVLTPTTATWFPEPSGQWIARGIGCTGPTRCVLTGFNGITRRPLAVRVDTGTGLVGITELPAAAGERQVIDCQSTTCVAVGDAGPDGGPAASPATTSQSDDGGVTWSTTVRTDVRGLVRAVACTAAGTCLAGGDTGQRTGAVGSLIGVGDDADGRILRSTDDGRTWTPVTVPADTRTITSMGCAAQFCVAAARTESVEWRLLRSTDDGLTWTIATTPAVTNGYAAEIECVPDACFAAVTMFDIDRETAILRSDPTGTTWTQRSVVQGTDVELQCLDGDRCLRSIVVGLQIVPERTINGGATWTPVTAPAGEPVLRVQGCIPGRCYAQGGAGSYATDDLGSTWRQVASAVEPQIGRTACGPTRCVTSATTAMSLLRTSAGFVDAPMSQTVRTGIGSVVDMACASDATCVVLTASGSAGANVVERVTIAPNPLIAILPQRLLDTRVAFGSTVDRAHENTGKLAAGGTYALPVRGRGLVGTSAGAVTATVTVTEPAGPGFVTVYPCGTDRPTASNVNVSAAGQTVANAVTVPLAADGTMCLYTSIATHLVVDANAYMPLGFPGITSVPPARLLDTRPGLPTVDGVEQGAGAFAAGETRALRVRGRGLVPADATTVTLNVGAVDPTGGGFLTVYPCDRDRPNASNVNHRAGATASNAVTVPIAGDGTVCIFALTATHVIADVTAFVGSGIQGVVSVTPARLLDTRSGPGIATVDGRMLGTGMVGFRDRIVLPVAGRGEVPIDARTVTLTATVTGPTGPGFLTVSPCPVGLPTASNINYATGDTIANAVTVPLADGNVCIDVLTTTHVVVDVNAYTR